RPRAAPSAGARRRRAAGDAAARGGPPAPERCQPARLVRPDPRPRPAAAQPPRLGDPACRPCRAARLRCDPRSSRVRAGERMPAGEAIVVLVTAGSEDEAATIGRTLVAERLAACVNVVGPMRSIYRWQGAIEDAREWLLVVKARAADLAALEDRIR